MTELEKYLFDLQGFLVVRGLLTEEEVVRLNAAVDANREKVGEDGNSYVGDSSTLKGERKRGMFTGMLTWDKPWCEPFRELLAHPGAIPYLDTILGRGWKLDHMPFLLCGGSGAEGLRLHGPGHQFDGAQYYVYKNGTMRCGMVVLQFQLADVLEGQGGFCCIPGSHKANFRCPREVEEYEAATECVINPACRAGDMILFNEATTHGTLPWRAPHERRSLLYRFSPKYLHFAGGVYQSVFPEWVNELTEAQRAVLEPPYIYHHPLIEPDAKTVVRPRREG